MSSPLLLITGASGFIGSETVFQALNKGYRARLTVRRPEQIDEIRARYAATTSHADKLEFVVVPEIDNKEALKPALEGVDYILHIASPLPANDVDLQTGYIDPAVGGTLAVLELAEHVKSIKRVIITASFYSLSPLDVDSRPGYVVEEGANASVEIDLSKPFFPAPFTDLYKYQISKVLAHREALAWVAQHKPAFDVVAIHPFEVVGHDRALQKNSEGVVQPRPVNMFFLYSLQSEAPLLNSGYVDVRDVAAMEVAAITVGNLKPRGGITEFLSVGPAVTWSKIRAYVKSKYPDFPLKQTSDGKFAVPPTANTDRAKRDMGIVFHDPLETLAAMLDQHEPISF